jgi:hypothetical protein
LLYLADARIIASTSPGASRLSSRMFPALSMNLSPCPANLPSSPTVLSALNVAPLGLTSVVVGGGSARSAPTPVGSAADSETPARSRPLSRVARAEAPAPVSSPCTFNLRFKRGCNEIALSPHSVSVNKCVLRSRCREVTLVLTGYVERDLAFGRNNRFSPWRRKESIIHTANLIVDRSPQPRYRLINLRQPILELVKYGSKSV